MRKEEMMIWRVVGSGREKRSVSRARRVKFVPPAKSVRFVRNASFDVEQMMMAW